MLMCLLLSFVVVEIVHGDKKKSPIFVVEIQNNPGKALSVALLLCVGTGY